MCTTNVSGPPIHVYPSSLEECEHAVVQWFQWLLEKLPEFDRYSNNSTMVLLLHTLEMPSLAQSSLFHLPPFSLPDIHPSPTFPRACDGECSYGELLLLIAIHLREGHLPQLEELISDTLQMKVSVRMTLPHVQAKKKTRQSALDISL